MAQTLLLFTDRPVFAEAWSAATTAAGFDSRAVQPEALSEELSAETAAAVFDGASEVFDEDELLACVGLARALGVQVAVALPEGERHATTEELLGEVCRGLLSRGDEDSTRARLVSGLAKRCDAERGGRFEFLAVSPRGTELVAMLSDGSCALLPRPLAPGDDGSEVSSISLAQDARSAAIGLGSGHELTVSLSALNGGAANADPMSALSDVDGVRLGQRLRELRLEAGLTQAELARRTGIHRPNIARVEAGRHTPSLETLARLAAAIGVPTTRVLAG